MVNLIAERLVVPELIQDQMTPENIAAAAATLLESEAKLAQMRADLAAVRASLIPPADGRTPLQRAAAIIAASLQEPR